MLFRLLLLFALVGDAVCLFLYSYLLLLSDQVLFILLLFSYSFLCRCISLYLGMYFYLMFTCCVFLCSFCTHLDDVVFYSLFSYLFLPFFQYCLSCCSSFTHFFYAVCLTLLCYVFLPFARVCYVVAPLLLMSLICIFLFIIWLCPFF